MTNPHPDGFCPKCGYAMDPGTCPECGLRVYRSDLAAIPPNLQRIRTRRRVIRFGVVLGVLIIGWYGYRTVNWVKLLPTSTLLYLQGQSKNWITEKLLARHFAKSLTPAQSEAMVRTALSPIELVIRTPFPAGQESEFSIYPQGSLDGLSSIDDDNLVILVDGQRFTPDPSRNRQMVTFPLPALHTGRHKLSIDAHLDLWINSRAGSGTFALPVHFEREIECQAKPLHEFVAQYFDAESRGDVMASITSWVTRSATPSQRVGVHFKIRSLKQPVAFDLMLRESGKTEFECVGSLCIKAANDYTYGHYLSDQSKLNHAPQYDIRLVPSIDLAQRKDFTSMFAGSLEWDNVIPIPEPEDNGFQAPPTARPADRCEKFRQRSAALSQPTNPK